MRILDSDASRHGSTTEIAARMAETLHAGLPDDTVVDLRPAADTVEVESYDVVHMGHWLDVARHTAATIAAVAPRLVWLFSSCPIGDPPKPDDEPADVGDLVTTTHARSHRMFNGRLDRHRPGFAEKAMVLALWVPNGDFREWTAIDAWAAETTTNCRSCPGRHVPAYLSRRPKVLSVTGGPRLVSPQEGCRGYGQYF